MTARERRLERRVDAMQESDAAVARRAAGPFRGRVWFVGCSVAMSGLSEPRTAGRKYVDADDIIAVIPEARR